MLLSRNVLEEFKVNKYGLIVMGPLTPSDKDILFGTHSHYNGYRRFVGESHIELLCVHDASMSLRDELGIKGSTSVIMLKNGFCVKTINGTPLFDNTNSLSRLIMDELDIYI